MATVQARITKVEHDVGSGWYTILTDNDSVKKMTTKMQQKAEEAAAFRQSGELLDIDYSPKQRHDESSGRTYNNNYYEKAKTAAPPSANGASAGGIDTVGDEPQSASAGTGASGRTWNEDPLRAWRISLAAGAKLAVATLPLMPVEQRDFDTQKRIAMAWGQWLFTTPPPSTEAVPASSSYSEPPLPQNPDDDIPF